MSIFPVAAAKTPWLTWKQIYCPGMVMKLTVLVSPQPNSKGPAFYVSLLRLLELCGPSPDPVR